MHDKNVYKLLKIAFIFLLFYIFLFGIGSYGLLAKDEPRYCGCALEMIENHNFIVPKFNFQYRFDKPPLFYWLIAGSYKLFGVSEFSGRLPSAISAILLVLFTWYTASKILGKKCGFISAVVLATSAEYLFLGRRAATDIVLCLFFSGAMYSMYLSYFIKDIKMKIFWLILSGIFAGFAILTKGPIGLVLQLFILAIFQVFRKQLDKKHIKLYFSIILIALVISLPWFISVHLATNGEFTKTFFFTHNFERFTSVVGEHPGPVWFYFPVMLLGFMPWTLFFLPGVYFLLKRIKKKTFNKFILFNFIWTIVVFLFFSFSKTKMATYVLLLFPPLSIITGHWVCIIGKKKPILIRRAMLFLTLVLSIGIILASYLISRSQIVFYDRLVLLTKVISCFAIFITFVTMLFFITKKYFLQIFYFIFLLAMIAVYLLNSYLVIYYKHVFGDLRDYAILARKLGAKEIISIGGYKPILSYYGRIPVDLSENKSEQIKKIKKLLQNGNDVYVIGYLSDIENGKRKSPLKKDKDLFEKLKIIKSGRKYFIGKFVES